MKLFIIETPNGSGGAPRSAIFPGPYTEVVADSILVANPHSGYRKREIEETKPEPQFIVEIRRGRSGVWAQSLEYSEYYSSEEADEILKYDPNYRKRELTEIRPEPQTSKGNVSENRS
jgi:Uma2 family endonuclease